MGQRTVSAVAQCAEAKCGSWFPPFPKACYLRLLISSLLYTPLHLPTLTSHTSLLAHSLGVLQVLWADSELRFGTVSRMGPRELSTSSVLPCCEQPDTSAAELPSALGAWNCGCATVLQTRLLLITPLSGADDWGDVAGSLFSGRKWNWESVRCTNTADCPALREDPLNYTSLVDMRQATSCVASFI